MNKNIQDVSDPLKHLLSLEFNRTSPLLNEISLDESNFNSPKQIKKVRFANPFAEDSRNHGNESRFDTSEVKGILKKKLSLEESEYALSNLNLDDYSDDYSEISSGDESSVDESAFSETMSDDVLAEEIGKNENGSKEHLNGLPQNQFEVPSTKEVHENVFVNSENGIEIEMADDENQTDTPSDFFEHRPPDSVSNDKNSIGFTSNQNVNQNILSMLSKMKAVSGEIHRKNGEMKPVDYPSKKPKFHLCVVSLSNEDSDSSMHRNFQNSKLCNAQITALNGGFKQSGFREQLNFDTNLASKQTTRLQSLLKEQTVDVLSANELKSTVFNAWNKIKNLEKSTKFSKSNVFSEFHGKKKTVKSSVSAKGYLYWKQIKELNPTPKRLPKPKSESNVTVRKLSEEEQREKNMEIFRAYRCWKQKKDKQYWLKHQKELKKAKMNKTNFLKQEEMRKKDAASAFQAWKAMKLNSQVPKEDQPKKNQMKIEQLKLEQKAERDKESQEAYFSWLQQKEKSKHGFSLTLSNRPPWNPPG